MSGRTKAAGTKRAGAKRKTAKKKTAKGVSNAALLRSATQRSRPPEEDVDEIADAWIGKRKGPGRPRSNAKTAALHVRIDETIHQRSKIRAVEIGRPLNSIVEELLSEWLSR